MSTLMQIPKDLGEEISNMFEEIEGATSIEFEVDGTIEEIEHRSMSGFMPFTNGGFQFTAPIDLYYLDGSGKDFVDKDVSQSIDETVERCYINARENFIAVNREALTAFFSEEQMDSNSDEINYYTLCEIDQSTLAEILSETEREYIEDYLFIEHRVQFYAAENCHNETDEDEMCFLSGVNLDYGYGRDKGLTITFERTVKVSDLTPNIIKDITKEMLLSI